MINRSLSCLRFCPRLLLWKKEKAYSPYIQAAGAAHVIVTKVTTKELIKIGFMSEMRTIFGINTLQTPTNGLVQQIYKDLVIRQVTA